MERNEEKAEEVIRAIRFKKELWRAISESANNHNRSNQKEIVDLLMVGLKFQKEGLVMNKEVMAVFTEIKALLPTLEKFVREKEFLRYGKKFGKGQLLFAKADVLRLEKEMEAENRLKRKKKGKVVGQKPSM